MVVHFPAYIWQILRSWNPLWNPKYWMTDYSEAEMLALRRVFQDPKIYLCDFLREQCWTRWVQDRKHGLTSHEGDLLLALLRKMVFAKACDEEGKPVNTYFMEAEEQLRKSEVWKNHQNIRSWLESKWLSIPEVYSF